MVELYCWAIYDLKSGTGHSKLDFDIGTMTGERWFEEKLEIDKCTDNYIIMYLYYSYAVMLKKINPFYIIFITIYD